MAWKRSSVRSRSGPLSQRRRHTPAALSLGEHRLLPDSLIVDPHQGLTTQFSLHRGTQSRVHDVFLFALLSLRGAPRYLLGRRSGLKLVEQPKKEPVMRISKNQIPAKINFPAPSRVSQPTSRRS